MNIPLRMLVAPAQGTSATMQEARTESEHRYGNNFGHYRASNFLRIHELLRDTSRLGPVLRDAVRTHLQHSWRPATTCPAGGPPRVCRRGEAARPQSKSRGAVGSLARGSGGQLRVQCFFS